MRTRALIALVVAGLTLGFVAQWSLRTPGKHAPVRVDADVRPTATRAMPAPTTAGAAAVVESSAADPRDEPLSEEPDAGPEPQQDRFAQLVSAGFTQERALQLLGREAQLRRESVEREYAATGTVQGLNASSPNAIQQQLRKEMGDGEYEKYLSAIGQTTRIRVAEVESDSAAANAGIQSGDEILAYGGQRVFNQRELNALMLKTREGEMIPATVVRNGQTMQLFVTGGMLGIAQGGSR